MQVRLKVFERGFQRPAFAVEVSHPFGRHLARDIGQDVEHRRPVSGRFVQLEAQATKEMLGALRIYHAHALLGHLTRWRAATRAQRASNLKTSPLMCTGDEEGAQVVDLTEKIPGFDQRAGHSLLLLYDVKTPRGQNVNEFNGLWSDFSN